jgi:hypothetical protein
MYEVVPDIISYTVAHSIYDLCPEATKRTPSRITNTEVRARIKEVYRYSFWVGTNQTMPSLDRLTGDHVGDETCVYARLSVRACIMSEKSDVDPYDTETTVPLQREELRSQLCHKLWPTVFWGDKGVVVDFFPEARQWKLLVPATRWTGWEMFKEGLKDQRWFHHSLYHRLARPHTPEVLRHEWRCSTWHTRHLRSSSLMVLSFGPWLASDCRLMTKLMRR